jgi:hypothetical protein
MSKSQTALDRLQNLIDTDLPHISKNIIVEISNNVYRVFDRYTLHVQKNRRAHILRGQDLVAEFTTARLAMAWCIADKHNQQSLRDQILMLDRQKSMMADDLYVRSALVERMRDRSALEIKLDTKRLKLKQLDFRLDKCVSLAKYWQTQGSNDETVRTGRAPSKRTSRQGI